MQRGTEFWVAHVAAARLEGGSSSAYARRHHLTVSALYYWQRKLKNQDQTGPQGRSDRFIALPVAAPRPERCTLMLPSGMRLDLSALPPPEWLAALTHHLPGAH